MRSFTFYRNLAQIVPAIVLSCLAMTASLAAEQSLQIGFKTLPDPPRSGDNQVEVTVKDASGAPVSDASVNVRFYMPAMPTMNMPEMQSSITPTHVSGGLYRGAGKLVMGGTWEVTVTVLRDGKRVGQKKLSVQAKGK